MVEIGLEAVKGDKLPKDLYVSLRVGEAQKFMKANCDRSYKFPASALGDRKYAKLEMFKRVGVCAIPVDTERIQGTHEVAVAVDGRVVDVPEKAVAYKVNIKKGLSGGQAPLDSSTRSATDKGAPDNRVASAKAYLDSHQLEQRLAEAMMAVLRERPEDPGKFIAEKLASGAGMLKKVADTKPGIGDSFRKLPSVGTWLQAKPPVVNTKVPQAEKPTSGAGMLKKVADTTPGIGNSFRNLPSVGTWLQKPPEVKAAPTPASGPVAPKAEPTPALAAPAPPAKKFAGRPECDPIMPVSLMVTGSSIAVGSVGRPWVMIL
jgi:hypothetical protein